MAGATPILGLPYPTGTDRVADGDNAIQALAAKLEEVLSPTWQNLAFQSPWRNWGAPNQHCQFRKVGDEVQLRGMATGGTAGTTLAFLPAGMQPPLDVILAINTSHAMGTLIVNPTGQVSVNAMGASGWLTLAGLSFSTKSGPAAASSKPGPDDPDPDPEPEPHTTTEGNDQ